MVRTPEQIGDQESSERGKKVEISKENPEIVTVGGVVERFTSREELTKYLENLRTEQP